jgi:hypothetical protein
MCQAAFTRYHALLFHQGRHFSWNAPQGIVILKLEATDAWIVLQCLAAEQVGRYASPAHARAAPECAQNFGQALSHIASNYQAPKERGCKLSLAVVQKLGLVTRREQNEFKMFPVFEIQTKNLNLTVEGGQVEVFRRGR